MRGLEGIGWDLRRSPDNHCCCHWPMVADVGVVASLSLLQSQLVVIQTNDNSAMHAVTGRCYYIELNSIK